MALPTQGVRLRLGSAAISPTYTDIAFVTTWNGPNGQKNEIDVTHLASTAKEFLAGLPDWGTYDFEIWFDHLQATHDTLRDLFVSGDEVMFQVVYTGGGTGNAEEFLASVLNFRRTGQVDNAIQGIVTLRITGDVDVVTVA